jgi:hypothetical protein
MDKIKICIIGCGTYGSYLLKRILDEFNDKVEITVIEIGNEKTRSEQEMGVGSRSSNSNVAKAGRYFGLGGTSARWGGQIIFFDRQDNPLNDPTWEEIIAINQKHQGTVVGQLLGNSFRKLFLQLNGPLKAGIWLRYAKRNLFNQISKSQLKKVKIIKDHRVVEWHTQDGKISAVKCKNAVGEFSSIEADLFYLTAGAIESCRLLMKLNKETGLLDQTDLGKNFGDHLSVELFRMKKTKPQLEGASILPSLFKGSLVTKRKVVATKDGRVGYLHPIFNKDVAVFTSLKKMLFGKQKISINVKHLFQGIGFLIHFGWSILVLKRMYAHKNNWSLQLDIEQPFPNHNSLELLDERDKYGEPIIKVNWDVTEADRNAFKEIGREMEKLLQKEGYTYERVYDGQNSTNKIEDIYHPVGFIRAGLDDSAVLNINNKVRGLINLYHFSTAIFPSARSINPTAAGLCFIEQHLQYLQHLLKNADHEELSIFYDKRRMRKQTTVL